MTIHKNNIFTDTEEEEDSSVAALDQTDDEHVLSMQSSPSPVQSEESDADSYLDPDLYCLRRSDRQKLTGNLNVSFVATWSFFLLNNFKIEYVGFRRDNLYNN